MKYTFLMLALLLFICSEARAQIECEESLPDPGLPCGQEDFARNNIWLQNINFYGTRYITAERNNGTPYNIVTGNDAIYPYCPLWVQGPVVIARHPKQYYNVWNDGAHALNDIVIPNPPNGHRYIATNSIPVSTGIGQPAWPKYYQAMTAMQGTPSHVCRIKIVSGGSGYASGTTITIDPPNAGVQAVAQLVIVNGVITKATVLQPGSGYLVPADAGVTLANAGGGSGAVLIAELDRQPNTQDVWQEHGKTYTDQWTPWRGNVGVNTLVKPASDNTANDFDFIYRVVDVDGTTGSTEPNWEAWGSDNRDNGIRFDPLWFDIIAVDFATGGFANTQAVTDEFFRPNNASTYVYQFKGRHVNCVPSGTWTWPANEPNFYGLTFDPNAMGSAGEFWTNDNLDLLDGNGDRYTCTTGTLKWWAHWNAAGYDIWQSNTSLELGDKIRHNPANFPVARGAHQVARVVSSIISNTLGTEPDWNETPGGLTVEGNITWKNVGIDAADVDFRATGFVHLKGTFHVQRGARFHAYIKPEQESVLFEDDFVGTTSSLLTNWDLTNKNGDGWYSSQAIIQNNNLRLKSNWSSSLGRFRNGEVQSKLRYGYGKYEIDAIVPTNRGAFTAFWLASCCGNRLDTFDELDIFERADWYSAFWQGHHCTSYLMHTDHGWAQSPKNAISIESFNGFDLQDDWHNYALEWRPGHQVYTIDDRVVMRLPAKGHVDHPRELLAADMEIILGHSSFEQFCSNNSSYFEVDNVKVTGLKTVAEKQVQGSSPTVSTIRGQRPAQLIESVMLYPNPSDDGKLSATIELTPGVSGLLTLEVFDVLGKRILQLEPGEVRDEYVTAIDVSGAQLAEGTYYCVFTISGPYGRDVQTHKLVINR